MPSVQIVVAWAENTGFEPTGRMIRKDGVNYFPEFRSCLEGKAAMWLRKGSQSDIAKAEAYAAADGFTVYTFPANEKNPLAKARAAIIEHKTAASAP